MSEWLRGKRKGLIAFVLIAALVAGGLGWATAAALRLEQQQVAARAEAELRDKMRLALWHLDSFLAPILAREDSRPYDHYSAVYAPSLALESQGTAWPPGAVLEPSPLLSADLPDWMLLHFQVNSETGWSSPQVLSPALGQRLNKLQPALSIVNVTPRRRQLLDELKGQFTADQLLALAQQHPTEPGLRDVTLQPTASSDLHSSPQKDMAQGVDTEYANRAAVQQQMRQSAQAPQGNYYPGEAIQNTIRNGEGWFSHDFRKSKSSESVAVTLGPLTPLWVETAGRDEQLLLVRCVHVVPRQVCQGIVLDWPRLREVLRQQVSREFPEATICPVRDSVAPHPERTMTALPAEFDPGTVPMEIAPVGWTPLRVGLALAWMAALVALLAVGLGGWSLLDLSERRIRFVSAVTHELRTPLTTLRLYLDMLASGMVKEERQREDYLRTLNDEADRLNRLIGNVLDFSRLENQRPRATKRDIALGTLLEGVRTAWQTRCERAGKELVVETELPGDTRVMTDAEMVQQILGNLIDNACKYSQGAEDPHIWLRAARGDYSGLVFTVEDRGPGVPSRERRSIFRPFRRGSQLNVGGGGVGLGLALAQRWARLLGGRLSLEARQPGACFRLELP
jgi:signal transduction histidine kinase